MMRNIIANRTNIKILDLPYEFTHIKYYTPETKAEIRLMENIAFKESTKKNKGIYKTALNDSSKIFALKFSPGKEMFPYIYAIDSVIYKDGLLIVGLDEEKRSFFRIIK